MAQKEEQSSRKPLRLWPGVVIVIAQWVLRYVVPVVYPEAMLVGIFGEMVGAAGILIWWLFFSRAAWSERLGAVVLMVAAVFVTSRLVHVSIAKGAMGMLFPILVIPTLCLALVAWAVITRNLSTGVRRATMVAAILIGCGLWTLIRTGGFTGDFDHDFAWRWSKTPEEKLVEQSRLEPVPATTVTSKSPEPTETAQSVDKPQTVVEPQTIPAVVEAAEMQPEWPGFRGPERNSTIHGLKIKTDWSASPPVELWRQPVGPGWSSFAVDGNLVYTQEQRGDDELVSCYNITTGDVVWTHTDSARFWESNAGAGPRGTPTLSNGRVYTFGATGILNALDASNGALIWTRNAATDTGTKVPGWGFSSSPLVVGDLVIVAAAGQLVAYDIATGEQRWLGPEGGTDYSSPHLMTIDGVEQVLLMCKPGVISVAPADGKLLWKFELPAGTRIVQPALMADGDLLISDGDRHGMRRIAVKQSSGGWKVEERWNSIGLKPYFSDFVIQDGHVYGFDGSLLSCIDIKDGKRKWKGGRYGHGQFLLLADQKLLVLLSEEGELALVSAVSDQFKELARLPAIEGKTWNHPALAGDVLLVRNGEEMAAFKLSLAGR